MERDAIAGESPDHTEVTDNNMATDKNQTEILIIGAGPTGLGAAQRLTELGADWLLLERNAYPGGLATSFQEDEFTWDLGGHVIFSHYRAYDQMLDRVIPEDEWVWHERVSHIRIRDRWVPYPFQANVWKLPREDRWRCLRGIIRLYTEEVEPDRSNFQRFIDTHFGDGIASIFMNPYNFKVWGYPPREMSADWIGERVAKVDLENVVRNMVFEQPEVSWGPNDRFRFPHRGGTGEIWRRLAEELPSDRVRFDSEVVALSTEDHAVELEDGRVVSYETLINTMPLDRLIEMSNLHSLSEPARGLRHSSVHVVGLGMRGRPPEKMEEYCWMYFPENNCPFYRATLFSNYSPTNTPEGHWSLMLETSETPVKPVDSDTIIGECRRGCRAAGILPADSEVVTEWYRRVQHGYPTPSKGRDARLRKILPRLQQLDIYSRGRFGAWQYEVGNMDHSYAQGREVAERIVLDTPESTVKIS